MNGGKPTGTACRMRQRKGEIALPGVKQVSVDKQRNGNRNGVECERGMTGTPNECVHIDFSTGRDATRFARN